MTWSDVVALVGAAAWLPQIGRLIYKRLQTPTLELISAPRALVGFTPQGPFLQLTASISSQVSDVIITRMTVLAKHQSGEQRLLTWSSLTETLASFQLPTEASPLNLPMQKTQGVLAIKAITEGLSERHIGFIDLDFLTAVQDKTNLARENFKYATSEPKDSSTLSGYSTELKKAEQFVTDNVFWREGSYRLEVTIFGRELKKPHEQILAMNLSRRDIDDIMQDIPVVKEHLRTQVSGDVFPGHKPRFAHVMVIAVPS